jgi:nitrite reductase/ring-hydroxylating ferredoxin subunit
VEGAPSSGQAVCRLSDLDDPGALGFQFRDGDRLFQAFAVRRGAAVYGYIDRCPHAGWPLALEPDRFLTQDKAFILCAGHGALFRLQDGVCVAGPCAGKALRSWPLVVNDGLVFCQ